MQRHERDTAETDGHVALARAGLAALAWVRPAFAKHQPVTAVIDAVRALVLGGPTTGRVLTSLAWSVGILAVFAPLAVLRYRRTG